MRGSVVPQNPLAWAHNARSLLAFATVVSTKSAVIVFQVHRLKDNARRQPTHAAHLQRGPSCPNDIEASD